MSDTESDNNSECTNENAGEKFLKVSEQQSARLEALVADSENYLTCKHLSEKIMNQTRLAVGMAKLLLSKKMQNFKDLCRKNIDYTEGGGEYRATKDDLEALWEIITMEIDHVDSLFDEITSLKRNSWGDSSHNRKSASGSGSARRR